VRYAFTTMSRRSIALSCALALVACNQGPTSGAAPPESAPPTPTTPAATASASNAIHLGGPVSAPEVALADVAKDPSSFTGRAFTTHGTVTAVCQEMGCWMEIKDASNGAHLRMHGHSFFVPKTANGRQARVQATLVPSGAAKACADDECASKNLALLQLDATGVELD
jgi:hypothetical protein